MKIILVIVLSCFSISAFATKARIIALSNSFHLVDEQYGYTNPINFHGLGNIVALETGLTTSTTARNNAEGLISYGLENQKRVVVELGKNDDSVLAGRTLVNSIIGAGSFVVPQNPVHLFYGGSYGDLVIYGGGYFSNFNNKVSGAKESSSGLVLSVKTGTTVIFANYSLANSAESAATEKFEGAGNLKVALRHKDDDVVYGFDVLSWAAKSSLKRSLIRLFLHAWFKFKSLKMVRNSFTAHRLFQLLLIVKRIFLHLAQENSHELSFRYGSALKRMRPIGWSCAVRFPSPLF